MTKHHASPTAAITTPATAGPINREPFTRDEFRAMAFGKSSRRAIIAINNACRAGMSNAFTNPWNILNPAISQMVPGPDSAVNATQARATDWIRDNTWVTTSTRWRFQPRQVEKLLFGRHCLR